jgi:hypothetical protein
MNDHSRRAPSQKTLVAALAVAASTLAGGAIALAATGDLTYRGCITGEMESGPDGSAACEQIPDATPGGEESGLDDLEFATLSNDGKSLYTASGDDAAVSRFRRDTQTGALTYRNCITGDADAGPSGSGACAATPDATSGGFGEESGLDNLKAVAVSGDGRWLYAASSGDDAVSRFRRDTQTGALTYRNCITGETESGPGGSGACAEIPDAASFGDNSGLDSLQSLSLSAESLYAASDGDSAVSRFRRDLQTGALTYRACITGETESGPAPGSGACANIPEAASSGDNSGLESLDWLALSGGSLYSASSGDDAVGRFRREP